MRARDSVAITKERVLNLQADSGKIRTTSPINSDNESSSDAEEEKMLEERETVGTTSYENSSLLRPQSLMREDLDPVKSDRS